MKKQFYTTRVEQMIREINSSENVSLVSYWKGDPLSNRDLSSLEQDFNFPIDEKIIQFYQEMNGLQIRWVHKQNSFFDSIPEYSNTAFDPLLPSFEEWKFDGSINIWPLRRAIIEENWEDVIWFNDEDQEINDFVDGAELVTKIKQCIRPFDIFQTYYAMAFYLNDSKNNWSVLMVGNYFQSFNESLLTNFESYVNFLFATLGSVFLRQKYFYCFDGFRNSMVKFPPNWKPDESPVSKEWKGLNI